MHGAITKPVVISTVLTEGHAGNLAKGQLAFVKNKAAKGLGAEVVSSFEGMTQKDLISIRVGEYTSPSNLRIKEVPAKSTGYFSIGSIVDIKAYAPSNVELKVDHLEVGYDGINDDTALYIPEGKSAVMDILVHGEVASLFFGRKEHLIQKRAHRAVGETMQTVIERLVKEINEDKIPVANGFTSTEDSLSKFLEVGVINNETVATVGVDSVFSTLTVKDEGDSNDLADIQAQYSAYNVQRTGRIDGVSTYTILHLASETLTAYTKVTVNVDGKGCEDCQAGYTKIDGGYVYHVALEDDGTSALVAVQAIPGAVAGSAVKVGNENGKGTYSVVTSAVLTDAQIATFIAANVTAEFSAKGEIKEVCSSTDSEVITWVDGETCVATTKEFRIVLKDNECGQSRLVELQKAYPELVVAAVAGQVGGCKRAYSTTMPTNIVCSECSPSFLQPFYADAPEAFEGTYWTAVETPTSDKAKMGFFIKGKPFYIYPESIEEDFIPFMETSLKVRSASFGWREDDILNYTGSNYDVDLEFAKVERLAYAQDVDNLSQNFFGAERMGNKHYTNKTEYSTNLFSRANLSQERILKYHKRVVQYHIIYRDQLLSQGGAGRSDITHDFMIIVEQGKNKALETILGKLAAKVGLEAPRLTV